MDFKTEILKSIEIMIDKKLNRYEADRTYESIIKGITPTGYTVLDKTGNERVVQCCIPGTELKISQKVWIKEPGGNLNRIHICGVAEK